jgi:WD40-like Beta Propeller Repeat
VSIEELLNRTLSAEADGLRPTPDVEALLARGAKARRRRSSWIVAAVLVVVLGVAGVAAGLAPSGRDTGAPPANSPGPTQPREAAGALTLVDVSTGRAQPFWQDFGAGAAYLLDVSPDGGQIAYIHVRGHLQSLEVANWRGDERQRVAPRYVDAFDPRWSPDGSQLVYQRYGERRPGSRQAIGMTVGKLFVVDVATGRSRQITDLSFPTPDGRESSMSPSFSPDGKTVLFHMLRRTAHGATWDLRTVPARGGSVKTLVRRAAYGSYSPDGSSIAYISVMPQADPHPEDVYGTLWVADADGGHARAMVNGIDVRRSRWSPDGTRIAYDAYGGTFVLDLATRRSRMVTTDLSVPEWFDNKTLVFPS